MAEVGNGQSVRNSTGKLKGKAKGPDDGPNYLRASTGSCHDFCKYGTPHEFKPKPKRPVRRNSTSNAEIPIEIFTPSDKRSAKTVKLSSASPPIAKVATKQEAVVVSGTSTTSKPVRQPASASTKVRSSQALKQTGEGVSSFIKGETSLDVKPMTPDLSKYAKEPSMDVKSLSADSSKSVNKQESSPDVKSPSIPSFLKKGLSSERRSIKGETSLDAKPMTPDLSKFSKEPSLDVKSLSADSSKSVNKQESSPDVKSPSIPSFLKKGLSSERQSSTSSLKSTVQDAQSRRKSSLSNVSGISFNSKPTSHSQHLTPGSSSKTSVVGRKSSSLDASKSVKSLAVPSTVKSPLKQIDASTKAVDSSLKSKSNRARTQQTSSYNLVASKIGRKTASATTSLPLNTRKSLASSSVALTPNLPGTKVARLNVRSSITKTESGTSSNNIRTAEASSSSKKPDVPEKTLHMIELETNNQQSPGSFDSLCQSKSAFSSQDAVETESESEYTDSEADDTVSSYRRGPGKDRAIDNETEGIKLKFRRGKVIDPDYEANSPRRLRFRKKSVSEDKQHTENEMKVVLRHQDMQEKRNEQGLLNDVIEEAASKLKETRKSKVKALVGAFESVISLQETKPLPSLSPGR